MSLRPVYHAWMRFGLLMSRITTPLIMGLVFYVVVTPIGLVRRLYETKREPVLGGEPAEVSILFSDIKDFTSISERMPPDELARALGRYLEVMTAAVHSTEGVIDKYIGDAVMAWIWNGVSPCADHAVKACRAVVACQEATRALYASREWQGRPLVTRYGLYRDRVMVGHFGAPDRMSFTALGDGVNLASRLEGLNNQYGTQVLASEAIWRFFADHPRPR